MVTTTKFRMLTEQVAAGLDAPDTRIITVAHPLGGTDEATILSWADAAVDEVLALLVGSDVVGANVSTPAVDPDPTEGIDAAVAEVRALVAADGGDIELVSFDGATARLRLVLESAECRECVMPGEFLERVALDKLQATLPLLVSVLIDDPRN